MFRHTAQLRVVVRGADRSSHLAFSIFGACAQQLVLALQIRFILKRIFLSTSVRISCRKTLFFKSLNLINKRDGRKMTEKEYNFLFKEKMIHMDNYDVRQAKDYDFLGPFFQRLNGKMLKRRNVFSCTQRHTQIFQKNPRLSF